MLPRKRNNIPHPNNALGEEGLIGIGTLKRILERDFFAEASLNYECTDQFHTDLIIHLTCNFGLTESLFHLNNGNWGNFKSSIENDVKTSPFYATLLELESQNSTSIDIKELSIHLRDTSLVISRLPNCQIQDHLEQILDAVSSNFVHFIRGLAMMPYEIFVPIYEETENNFPNSESKQPDNPNYLEYWGLYFEDEIDALVYDVNNRVIIEEGDFFLLNQWG